MRKKIDNNQRTLASMKVKRNELLESISSKEEEIEKMKKELHSLEMGNQIEYYKKLVNRFFKFTPSPEEYDDYPYQTNISAILQFDEKALTVRELTIYKNLDDSFDFQIINVNIEENNEYYENPSSFVEVPKKEFDFFHNACLTFLNSANLNSRNVLVEKRKKQLA